MPHLSQVLLSIRRNLRERNGSAQLPRPPLALHPTRARMRMPNTPPCRSLCGPPERLPMPCNRMLCARSGDRLLPPQEHGASGMGSGVRPRPRSPIFKARARVPTLTLTPPSTGVAAGAWARAAQGGGTRVAVAAPLAAPGRSPHPRGAVQQQRRQQGSRRRRGANAGRSSSPPQRHLRAAFSLSCLCEFACV